MNFSRTKIVGYLILAGAVIKVAIDALDGSGFDLQTNWDAVLVGLGGIGAVFMREGIKKGPGK